ncbi:hypothetical protein P775_05180 [Puniceibacterium antarcticum]|uniref:TonB-denpendent receptor n=2 Tax=Puniceibacterium antarcticum TaxID=1206336 RepID=A0A2G8RIR3_9RHOB|nr:hypothetical protein P775_05180 [Puniceibacterium antarcticum]
MTLLMMTVASGAMAQAIDDPFALQLIVVDSADDATGPVDGARNPTTTTGSKMPLELNRIPQSVSVLGRDEIDRFKAHRVSEALRYTAGVSADVYGDDEDYDWMRIRGFKANQNGTYLDNAQNLAISFGSFFIDPYTLERIEVLRGPSSALYGGSNPGGILNYVSKRPGERIREVTIGANDASAGWLEFDMGDDLGNGRSYRVTGRLEGGDKYDDFNHGLRGTLAPSFKFTTDGGTEITLLANIHAAEEQHNGSNFLPYYGTVKKTEEFGYIDPDANFSDSDWDKYSRRQIYASAIVKRELANGFTFEGIGRVSAADLDERYYYPSGYLNGSIYADGTAKPNDDEGTLRMAAFTSDARVRTAQTDLRFYGTLNSGAVTHDVMVGLDARYFWLDETLTVGLGTPNSVKNPSDPSIAYAEPPYNDITTTQSQVGLYFQDQMRWGGGWIGTLNLRHDFVWTEQEGTNAFERDDSETSYRVGLAYETAGGLTPYASFSSFFNPLVSPPSTGVTKPETGHQVELGVKWAPQDSNFRLSAAAFQIEQQNVTTGMAPNRSQLGEVRSRGFELEGQYDFGNGLTMAGAATLLDMEITRDKNAALEGKEPTLNPEHELSLFARYAFSGALEGLSMGLGARHRGESWADTANKYKVPSSTAYDMTASYAFGKGMEGTLSVTNLTDERNVTTCDGLLLCSYGSGREISVSLTSRF